MRKIRDLLRLKFDLGLSIHKIAASLSIARSTVTECLQRAAAAGVVWPLAHELDDEQLEARLYPKQQAAPNVAMPDFAHIPRELSRPGVTRLLLWQEYKAQHPDGPQYSTFCDHFRAFLQRAEPVMRFEHRAGDKCFVDYANQTAEVIDRTSGEIRQAQIFVAVLGCSNYTYAEASWTQALADWLGAHVRALAFFGGAPAAFVPDNLKSGVDRAHRYDPDLNRAYAEFAEHCGLAILPARVRKPRDKSKVETAVQIVERRILARLRNRQFFSLPELNAAIDELLIELNERPFQKLDGSRHSHFIELVRPALKSLPSRAYEYAQWKLAKVHPDYHIEVDHAYYSVPYKHIGEHRCAHERPHDRDLRQASAHRLACSPVQARCACDFGRTSASEPSRDRRHHDRTAPAAGRNDRAERRAGPTRAVQPEASSRGGAAHGTRYLATRSGL